MIKVKHFMDNSEPEDGRRIWVEPFGLTADLREWCNVQHLLGELSPPRELWEWYQNHPRAYDFFRARYHKWLNQGQLKPLLAQLIKSAQSGNITLLHQGDKPNENTAMALYEFLGAMEAYTQP